MGTFADFRLQRLIEDERRLFAEFERFPERYSDGEKERRVRAVADGYQAFIADNPENVYALILYGKLLRRVGDSEGAKVLFLRADEINPRLAVVKQQVGNYLFEEGHFVEALPWFLTALELEPEVALYHYQAGETLALAKAELLADGVYTAEALDRAMFSAFAGAVDRAPHERQYEMRLAEAYFDASNPDWSQALKLWVELEATSQSAVERAVVRLQRARVLLELGRTEEARELALSVDTEPALEPSRREVLRRIDSSAEGRG
ncbi:MAG: tetratricopeptide repeat protein [Opitutales bacterium]